MGSPELTRGHVLVVEDDLDVCETLADLLRWQGYPVTLAANGQVALDLLRGGLRPDLILLDLMMPVMDGFAFRRAQRAHPAWASVPVVVMTAIADAVDLASSLGANDCLPKPFDVAHLLEIAARYCS